jgi:hypothetical protein
MLSQVLDTDKENRDVNGFVMTLTREWSKRCGKNDYNESFSSIQEVYG